MKCDRFVVVIPQTEQVNGRDIIDAQRLAVRQARTMARNGTTLPARPHQLKLGSFMEPVC